MINTSAMTYDRVEITQGKTDLLKLHNGHQSLLQAFCKSMVLFSEKIIISSMNKCKMIFFVLFSDCKQFWSNFADRKTFQRVLLQTQRKRVSDRKRGPERKSRVRERKIFNSFRLTIKAKFTVTVVWIRTQPQTNYHHALMKKKLLSGKPASDSLN